MNKKGYERLTHQIAPLFRWSLIFYTKLVITILELFFCFYVARSPPLMFTLLSNYGRNVENILRSFFTVSLAVDVMGLVMYKAVVFRSAWSHNGIILKYFILWFFHQTFFVTIIFVIQCLVYISLETTFEHDDMKKLLSLYKEDDEVRKIINLTQINLKCCGINTPLDWSALSWWVEDTGLDDYSYKVPKSCCSEKKCIHASENFSELTVKQSGCYNLLLDELENKYFISCILMSILTVLNISNFIVIINSLPDIHKIDVSYEEFIASKRLFTLLYQKSLMAKMRSKLSISKDEINL